MKHISKFLVCMLLVSMPLQAISTANIAACNSMLNAVVASEITNADMPCHQHMDNLSEPMHEQNKFKTNTACESSCTIVCASLNVVSIIPSAISPEHHLASSSMVTKSHQYYASVIQANLLRPPIFQS